MFEFKRAGVIKTEIKMGDRSVPISISIDQCANRLIKSLQQIEHARTIKTPTAENIKELEAASLELMRIVFGNLADEILTFYEGNAAEMMAEALPFLRTEIFPRFKEYGEARKKAAKKARRGW